MITMTRPKPKKKIPETKKYGNRVYKRGTTGFMSKQSADRYAREVRSRGRNARVHKFKGFYYVYLGNRK